MKRLMWIVLAAAGTAFLGACGGGGEVVVQSQLGGAEGEAQPISDMPVHLLPYDRDEIFDSLATAYEEPEPQIPDTVVALQDSIVAAQQTWREAESEWQVIRDSLEAITARMDQLQRDDPEYIALFRDFGALESRERELAEAKDEAFAAFTDLQQRFAAMSEEIRLRRQQWADEAFADVDQVIAARLEAEGREEHTDTTNAAGVVRFEVPAGQWWVHARQELPYGELYWNEPLEVAGGEPTTIELTRENAEERSTL